MLSFWSFSQSDSGKLIVSFSGADSARGSVHVRSKQRSSATWGTLVPSAESLFTRQQELVSVETRLSWTARAGEQTKETRDASADGQAVKSSECSTFEVTDLG